MKFRVQYARLSRQSNGLHMRYIRCSDERITDALSFSCFISRAQERLQVDNVPAVSVPMRCKCLTEGGHEVAVRHDRLICKEVHNLLGLRDVNVAK